jgi:hypothetical protein
MEVGSIRSVGTDIAELLDNDVDFDINLNVHYKRGVNEVPSLLELMSCAVNSD